MDEKEKTGVDGPQRASSGEPSPREGREDWHEGVPQAEQLEADKPEPDQEFYIVYHTSSPLVVETRMGPAPAELEPGWHFCKDKDVEERIRALMNPEPGSITICPPLDGYEEGEA